MKTEGLCRIVFWISLVLFAVYAVGYLSPWWFISMVRIPRNASTIFADNREFKLSCLPPPPSTMSGERAKRDMPSGEVILNNRDAPANSKPGTQPPKPDRGDVTKPGTKPPKPNRGDVTKPGPTPIPLDRESENGNDVMSMEKEPRIVNGTVSKGDLEKGNGLDTSMDREDMQRTDTVSRR